MEIKKIFGLFLILILMCGCTKQYTCTKEAVSDDFEYSIEMKLKFGNKKIKNVNSIVSYRLTEEGYKKIDTLKETLQSKNDNYSLNKMIDFNFKIDNKLISVYEDIDFSESSKDEMETLLTYNDLSTIYFNSKYKYKDVIEELKNNNFTCELE